jgi:uncharacterized membrane protein YbjE (DUF340 family)
MLLSVIFIAIGFLLGYFLRKPLQNNQFLSKLQTGVIIVMLFCMGLSVGINKTVMDNLGSLGMQALILSVLCVAGSIASAWLFGKLHDHKFKGRQNKKVL